MEPLKTSIAKAILKNKAGGITLLDSRQHQQNYIIKTVWYWHKNRRGSMEWNKTAQKNPHNYGQFIDKTRIYNMKKTISSASGVGKIVEAHVKE